MSELLNYRPSVRKTPRGRWHVQCQECGHDEFYSTFDRAVVLTQS